MELVTLEHLQYKKKLFYDCSTQMSDRCSFLGKGGGGGGLLDYNVYEFCFFLSLSSSVGSSLIKRPEREKGKERKIPPNEITPL